MFVCLFFLPNFTHLFSCGHLSGIWQVDADEMGLLSAKKVVQSLIR